MGPKGSWAPETPAEAWTGYSGTEAEAMALYSGSQGCNCPNSVETAVWFWLFLILLSCLVILPQVAEEPDSRTGSELSHLYP